MIMNWAGNGSMALVIAAFGVVAYLLGAIPNGFLIAKAKGIDIRKVGSGNIGATNVYRSVSKSLGILTFALDALKGAIPALWFPVQAAHCAQSPLPPWAPLLFGGLAIAGHTWPRRPPPASAFCAGPSHSLPSAICPSPPLLPPWRYRPPAGGFTGRRACPSPSP
jgi:hypothetical protein